MRGVALIEILVAVLVLSLGLLGLAGLQVTGLRSNHNAYLRSQASLVAYDIADRMRANVQGVIDGDYVAVAAPAQPTFDCMTDFTGTAEANRCSPAEMGQWDLYQWYSTMEDKMPSGIGSIACADIDPADTQPCSRGSIHTLTVTWTEVEVPVRVSGAQVTGETVVKSHVLEMLP